MLSDSVERIMTVILSSLLPPHPYFEIDINHFPLIQRRQKGPFEAPWYSIALRVAASHSMMEILIPRERRKGKSQNVNLLPSLRVEQLSILSRVPLPTDNILVSDFSSPRPRHVSKSCL